MNNNHKSTQETGYSNASTPGSRSSDATSSPRGSDGKPSDAKTSDTKASDAKTNSSDGKAQGGMENQSKAQTATEALGKVAIELKDEVGHVASDIAGDVKKAAETKLSAGKDFATDHLSSVAEALRKTGQELRSSQSPATEYLDKAAGSVEEISKYFQTRTLSQLINDVEGYARREPAVFLGGAFFVGMLGGRFLKSAAPSRAPQPGNGSPRSNEHRALPARGGSTETKSMQSGDKNGSNAFVGGGSSSDGSKRRDGGGDRGNKGSGAV